MLSNLNRDKHVPNVMRPDIVRYQFREWSGPQNPKCTIVYIILSVRVQVPIFLIFLPKLQLSQPSKETSSHTELKAEVRLDTKHLCVSKATNISNPSCWNMKFDLYIY